MSSVSSRPRVKSISSAVLEAAAISCVQSVGSLIAAAIRSLEAAGLPNEVRSSMTVSPRSIPAILPLSSIRSELPALENGIRHELQQHRLQPIVSAKLATLLSLQATPYVCEGAAIQAPLDALLNARNCSDVERASQRAKQAFEAAHQHTLTSALTIACRNASVQAGFECVEATPGLDGAIRVVAGDSAGRALVTEIRLGPDQEPSIETEVVGVADGTCLEILDRFDRSLEEQGVRGGPPNRKWTGGVCEMQLAKEFLKQRARKGIRQQPGPSSDTTDNTERLRRARKLNQKVGLASRQSS